MTVTGEILQMKRQFSLLHPGQEANILYLTDTKWHGWWKELARVGNPHVDEKLSSAIGRRGFAAMRGRVWEGMRVERFDPNAHPGHKSFVARVETFPEPQPERPKCGACVG